MVSEATTLNYSSKRSSLVEKSSHSLSKQKYARTCVRLTGSRHAIAGGGGHMDAVTSGQRYVTLLMGQSEVRLPNPRKRKVPVSQGRRQQR